jgi:hypothetical protein
MALAGLHALGEASTLRSPSTGQPCHAVPRRPTHARQRRHTQRRPDSPARRERER